MKLLFHSFWFFYESVISMSPIKSENDDFISAQKYKKYLNPGDNVYRCHLYIHQSNRKKEIKMREVQKEISQGRIAYIYLTEPILTVKKILL